MNGWDLAVIALVLTGYAVVSRRLAGTWLTAPMVFVTAGVLAGSEVFDVVDVGNDPGAIRLLAEATLALVLFSDASSLDVARLRREAGLPIRLLGIGLPLTIVAGSVLAVGMFSDLIVWEAIALAVLLAPTDAALGQQVVSDPRLPSRLRQGLNVEAGLNDGICVPLLLAAIAFAEVEETTDGASHILVDLVEEVAIAVGVGIAVAVAVGALRLMSERRGWLDSAWERVIPLTAAVLAYVVTAELGGSGFIASFVAGLVYGRVVGPNAEHAVELIEEVGGVLSATTFFVVAAVVVGPVLRDLDVATVVYAVLSLTVVRMLPVAISQFGSGARLPSIAFAGWFGPRGLASIVFVLTVVEESGLDGTSRIVEVSIATVVLSVFAHGISAPVLTERYSRWLERNPEGRDRRHTASNADA